jgi:hypothetical protein
MGPESAWSNHRVEPSLASLKELRASGFKCTPPGGENGRLGKTGAAEGHDAISIYGSLISTIAGVMVSGEGLPLAPQKHSIELSEIRISVVPCEACTSRSR